MRHTALFFSRGRGRGHALPDAAIAARLKEVAPELALSFASYATGAETLRTLGHPVIDLALPEANLFVPTLFKARELIEQHRPHFIIAHEEFAALLAAKLLGVPSIFISAWLPPNGNIYAESVTCADAVIVIDHPGIFPLPAGMTVKPHYTGPIYRQMQFTTRDRAGLRRELGWPAEAFVVVVSPGGSATEKDSPLLDLAITAFRQLPQPQKRLIWLSAKDHAEASARFKGIPGCEALRFVDPVERLLGAADVILTKGTRGATLDAAAVGVPSISISHGRNPVDDLLVPRIRTNVALVAKAVDADALAYHLQASSQRRSAPASDGAEGHDAVDATARHIRQESAKWCS